MGKTGCHTRGQGGSVSVRGGGAVARRGEQTAHRGACAEEDGRASSSGLGSNCPPSMSRGGPGDVRVAYMHMHGQCSLLKEEKSS